MERRTRRRATRIDGYPSVEWQLVLTDQNPMLKGECSAAMTRLEEVRTAWNRFEREDRPCFIRWRAREFGSLLSDLRDVEAQIRESQALVHEVEMEMRRGFYDPQSAYQRVMFRRENPASANDEPAYQPRGRAGEERRFTDFEKEALFQDWVQKFIGTNPDKLDDEAYSTTFEAFKSHMFRSRQDEAPPVRNFRRVERERPAQVKEEPEAAAPIDARVKELYRILVRRLHPDLRADGNAAASALWHEVQDAYAANDIAHLEILLAMSGIGSDRFSEHTSVSKMQALLAELKRALFALEDSLRQARHDDAWNFARSGATPGLRERVQRELQANLRNRSARLSLLKRTIADWSRPSRAKRPASSREMFSTPLRRAAR